MLLGKKPGARNFGNIRDFAKGGATEACFFGRAGCKIQIVNLLPLERTMHITSLLLNGETKY